MEETYNIAVISLEYHNGKKQTTGFILRKVRDRINDSIYSSFLIYFFSGEWSYFEELSFSCSR